MTSKKVRERGNERGDQQGAFLYGLGARSGLPDERAWKGGSWIRPKEGETIDRHKRTIRTASENWECKKVMRGLDKKQLKTR